MILSAVFDGIDGFLARKAKASDLGFSLDSLADLVSFGVAPASIAVTAFGFSGYALTVSLIYLTCGTLRLARFNVSDRDDEHFEGFPITASGIAIVASMLLDRPGLTLALMLILSILMVSSIPYPKDKGFKIGRGFCPGSPGRCNPIPVYGRRRSVWIAHISRNARLYGQSGGDIMPTNREIAAFEAGIKLGALYHQFVGSPISPKTADSLEEP